MITLILTLLLGVQSHAATAQNPPHRALPLPMTCPITADGEAPQDCPWAGAARILATPGTSLKTVLPGLQKAIRTDGRQTFIQGAWGESINFDELVKAEIVPAKILAELEQTFGWKGPEKKTGKGYQVAPAGLEHTYGYILSNLKTAYGFKRARWVSGEIERGLGLPVGLIGPEPTEGTLLSNVTYLLGKIAFRTDARHLSELAASFKKAPKALHDLDITKLKITRLQEEAAGGILLRTDIVDFTVPQTNTHLLVYSVVNPATSERAKLITAFPVTDGFMATVFDSAKLGDAMPIITRYNAYVPEITDSGTPITGKRSRIEE